jgi:branched-chain amino acid transport system substrate-binding protein
VEGKGEKNWVCCDFYERRDNEMRKITSLVIVFLVALFLITLPDFLPVTAKSPEKLPLKKEVIKIGGQGIFSGPNAICGRSMMEGARLAVEEINAKGGILGSKIEFKSMDCELKPAVGIKNARYLVGEWGADVLIGHDSSGVLLAVGGVMPELKKVLIGTHAATASYNERLVYREKNKYCFRTASPTYQDAIIFAHVFSKKFPEVKRWASINCDYEFGYVNLALFKRAMKELNPGVEFVAETWAPFWTMDFTPQISAVMAAKPEGIYTSPWGGEGVQLARQALIMGVFEDPKVKLYVNCTGETSDFLSGMSNEIAKDKFHGKLWVTGRYVLTQNDLPINKHFVKTYSEKYAMYPFHCTEGSYSAMYLIKKTLEKCRTLDVEAVIKAMEGMKWDTPSGEKWIRPEDHQAVYPVPIGRPGIDPNYPLMPVVKDLHWVPVKDYYRWPPFEPSIDEIVKAEVKR